MTNEAGELHIKCSCHTHELHIERDADMDSWDVSLWVRGYHDMSPWTWRLRCIWRIIKTGRPYGDAVILDRTQMQELSDYINTELNK